MSFVLYVITLVAAALGTILSSLIFNNLGVNSLGNLEPQQIQALLNALFWFLICVGTWFGASRTDERPFGFISVKFLIAWLFCNAGAMLGFLISILIENGSLSVQGEQLLDQFFLILPLTIGPTATTSMGLKEK
ncbi:MAG: hypothetical protein D6732_04890 [Methanobacteriota archaeon]|nr:MAG: hypothetical protein D6732_04890 [Euryarchaeota archaeon]